MIQFTHEDAHELLETLRRIASAAESLVAIHRKSAGMRPADATSDVGARFDVWFVRYPDHNKIDSIKVVRSLTGLGLKEAKDLIEAAPKMVKCDVPGGEALAMKAALEEVGATACVAPTGHSPLFGGG